ncbi:MAG: hypothetical protein NTW29_02890 [Bacteroidetes bacterium]|nr:hypothetical protein [Bacteroidota bacterium]
MMRIIILTNIFLILSLAGQAQQTPGTAAISTTGCTLQVYCFPGRFDSYELEDGSLVFADDCEKDGVTYGVYCVKLKTATGNLDAAEDSIATYLDFLKLDFGIVSAKGYDKGHRLNNDENTRGIYDTWEDADKYKWKVKAWTNRQFICVLYMHSAKELPEKKASVFLDGLRFPGMK